jgi:hypothetical protein
MISTPAGMARSSISISRSSSSPSRSILRNFCGSRQSRGVCRLVGGEAHHARLRQQRIEHALLGGIQRALAHLGHFLLAGHLHGDVRQLLDDRVDVAADIADLGELGGLHLHERRVRQLRQAPRDLGLADPGRSDHQDVLRRDLLAQRLLHLHAAPAVAQRDGHGALGRGLPDDVLVEFLDDLLRGVRASLMMFRHPAPWRCSVLDLDDQVAVGIDADVGGDVE